MTRSKLLAWPAALAFLSAGSGVAAGVEPPAAAAPTSLPVREVTVFKDGHAFLLRQGRLPTDAAGEVVVDDLPAPVLGAFWPFAAEPGVSLAGVVAGERAVRVEQPAASLAELVAANPGAECTVTERDGGRYRATIVAAPAAAVGNGGVVLVATADGTKALPFELVRDLTFIGGYRTAFDREERRDLLTLRLDWGGEAPRPQAEVGVLYLERGFRWVPSYRVAADGRGTATVTLQATLVNDLTPLEDATVNLVVGAPSFAFAGQLDPMALGAAAAEASRRADPGSQTAWALSNAIMTQVAQPARTAAFDPGGGGELAADQAAPSEDLYVFTVRHVTLGRGERMVLPVAEVRLGYRDLYTLAVPCTPPGDLGLPSVDPGREVEMRRLLGLPKVQHRLRLRNTGPHPLTTAPALILVEGRLLAQGVMTYTPVGAEVDLEATAAVDIAVRRSEVEVARTPDAVRWDGAAYARVDLGGRIALVNRRDRPVELEVVRQVLGAVDSATRGGAVAALNLVEEEQLGALPRPPWWWWYSWPSWWTRLNGLGQITWRLELQPGESAELDYTWHYLWR